MFFCKKCGKGFTKNKKFCNTSCAASFNSSGRVRSEESKLKTSMSLKKTYSENPRPKKPKKIKYCVICNSPHNKSGTTCSVICNNKNLSNIAKNRVKRFGETKNAGKSISGYYKGIYCGSTYELCWVIYNIDHNIKFERFRGILSEGDLIYIPDFLIEDGKTIVEIKGYDNGSVSKKNKLAESKGYNVKVLYKKDLKYAFEYVSKTYSNNYRELYDEYKPKYEYVCSYCGNKFFRDRKAITDLTFCSRICSGKYGHNRSGINGTTTRKIVRGYTYKRKNKQIWINDGINQTRINEVDIIPKGYIRGRIK